MVGAPVGVGLNSSSGVGQQGQIDAPLPPQILTFEEEIMTPFGIVHWLIDWSAMIGFWLLALFAVQYTIRTVWGLINLLRSAMAPPRLPTPPRDVQVPISEVRKAVREMIKGAK